MQDAASAFDPLPASAVLRIKKECDALGLGIVAFAWRIQKAAAHQCEAMLDKAQTEAYADGRRDEREDWQVIRVAPGFSALMESLERADRKGYMPDAIRDDWNAWQGWNSEPSADAALKDATPGDSHGSK